MKLFACNTVFLSLVLLLIQGNNSYAQENGFTPGNVKKQIDTANKVYRQKLVSLLNKQKNTTGSAFNALYANFKKDLVEPLFSIQAGTIAGKQLYTRSYFTQQSWLYSNTIAIDASLKGIPFNITAGYNNYPRYGDLRSTSSGFQLQFDFDYKRYIEGYNKKFQTLIASLDPELLLDSLLINYKNELSGTQDKVKKELTSYVNRATREFHQYKFMVTGDSINIHQLKNQLESSAYAEYYNQLKQQRARIGDSISADVKDGVREQLVMIDSVKRLIAKYNEAERKLKELQKYVDDIKSDIIKSFNGKDALQNKEILDLLGTNGLQQLLMKLSGLQIGNISLNNSLNSAMPPMNIKGGSIQFKDKNRFGGFDYGTIAEPYTSVTAVNNIMGTGYNDSLARKKATMWNFTYGIGDPDNEHVKLSLASIQNIIPYKNTSYILTINGATQIIKNTWLQVEIAKTITVNNSKNSIANASSSSMKGMGSNSLRDLAYIIELNGEYEVKGFNFRAGYQHLPQAFYNMAGTNSRSGRKRQFLSIRKELLDKKVIASFRYDRRNYLNGIYGNTNNHTTNISGEARYKFKKGQFVSLRFAPSSSAYNSFLKDSLLAQRMNGTSLGSKFSFRKRFHKTVYNIGGGVDYYKNKYLMYNRSLSDTTSLRYPFNSLAYQLALDVQGSKKISYFAQIFQLIPISKNKQTVLTWPGASKAIHCEGGIHFQINDAMMLTSGINYDKMKDYNEALGVLSNFNFSKGKWMFSFLADIKLFNKNTSNHLFGFANRYELSYQYKF